ncbi:MAG TPA: hypothetical protein H9926_02440 [Candidatus Eisenbergiella intestinigallinarum]|uniref:Lipoprotein n=1 Tax=Candidatus Eisenbergiella intestinigallinarum TaxID=2838549 RepID=A0A9D2QI29_9FIRM|nr:hypothetical protein [Candidatus Eisenbergiella intestinigallinarum]
MKKRCAVFTALLLLSLTAACSGRTAAQPPESSEAESEIIPGSTDESGTETSSDTSGESEMETSSEAGSEPAPASPAVGTSEKAHADVLLTAPPEITLSDSLSSANTSFTLHSGTGEWSWVDKDEITTSVACGSAPLDMDPEQAATLDVPDYNRLDSVPYLLYCVMLPDRILLREWDIQDLGVAEAEPLSETEYSEVLPIELKKDRVYELVATWEEEKLDERFFFGEASYLFLTE